MNRNRKIKAIAFTLSAGLVASTIPAGSVDASPIAGVVASMYANSGNTASTVIEEISPLSGSSLALSNILAQASVGLSGMSNGDSEGNSDSKVAPAAPGEVSSDDFSNIAIAKVDDYVNIRSSASKESEPLGKLYSNGFAEVLETDGEWARIRSGSVDGYVSLDYLSVGDKDVILSVSKEVVRINADTLNVREDMSTEARVVNQSGAGSTLDVVDDSMMEEGWVKVNTSEGEGYVSSEFVTVDRVYSSVAESKEEEAARLAAEAEAARLEAERVAQSQRVNNNTQQSSSNPALAPVQERHYDAPAGLDGSSVANYALQFQGNPYVYGGTSLTNGTDCSGFVMSVYNQFGVGLPHSSSSLRSAGYGVGVEDMQPGDIVCYSGHVGIYVGGGQIVHASNRRDGIKVSSAYYRTILAVRRIF